MKAIWLKRGGAAAVLVAAMLSAGCGELVRQGRSPMMLVVDNLVASPVGGEESGTLLSDVITGGGVINDTASVTLRVISKNPFGALPTDINDVTVTRYRVTFRRTDGRNTPGVDVPHPFDSAITITVPAGGTATAGFDFIRHNAKREPPLTALRSSFVKISTIADVGFFGRDQAGNDVSASASIGVTFGDFADPE